MPSSNKENLGISTLYWLPRKVVEFARKSKKLGKDDPRRIIHSIKVALALCLVSLFYYFKPTYNDFGANAIWAVLTVVFVLEFSVGATLGKGVNRILATLLAAVLGIGAHQFSLLFGKTGEPMFISLLVFLVAVSFTFLRFFPGMKLKYDFGLMVFILTFCLITILSYRQQLLSIAMERLVTIVIRSCVGDQNKIENLIPFEIPGRIKDPCTMISLETGKALQELASSIRDMVESTLADSHIANSKTAAENLKALFKHGLWEGVELVETISATAVVSLLLDVVICTEKIAEAVGELASLARFNSAGVAERSPSFRRSTIQPMSSADLRENHVVSVVE